MNKKKAELKVTPNTLTQTYSNNVFQSLLRNKSVFNGVNIDKLNKEVSRIYYIIIFRLRKLLVDKVLKILILTEK